jgi:hypothetical protein
MYWVSDIANNPSANLTTYPDNQLPEHKPVSVIVGIDAATKPEVGKSFAAMEADTALLLEAVSISEVRTSIQ